jgi:hypothetical protein
MQKIQKEYNKCTQGCFVLKRQVAFQICCIGLLKAASNMPYMLQMLARCSSSLVAPNRSDTELNKSKCWMRSFPDTLKSIVSCNKAFLCLCCSTIKNNHNNNIALLAASRNAIAMQCQQIRCECCIQGLPSILHHNTLCTECSVRRMQLSVHAVQ